MMKNNKLKIGELKLNSFVTTLEEEKNNTVKGGYSDTTVFTASYPNTACQDWCKKY